MNPETIDQIVNFVKAAEAFADEIQARLNPTNAATSYRDRAISVSEAARLMLNSQTRMANLKFTSFPKEVK